VRSHDAGKGPDQLKRKSLEILLLKDGSHLQAPSPGPSELLHEEWFPPSGILLHPPPGCLLDLQALGKERLEGWRITAPREMIVPDAWKAKDEMKRLELERMAKINEMMAY
jgi:hypothetical protein